MRRREPEFLSSAADPLTVQRISRRSWAVPLACVVAIAFAFISPFMAPVAFPLIPLFARLLDPKRRGGDKQPEAAPTDEASA